MSTTVNPWIVKKQDMSREQMIRFQILVYCHLQSIELTRDELKCLTHLGVLGISDLNYLCSDLVTTRIYTSSSSARNAVGRLESKGLVHKDGKNKKKVMLSPDMRVQCDGNIYVEIKCLYREPV